MSADNKSNLEIKCKYEEKIFKFAENISSIRTNVDSLRREINGTLRAMEAHINQGTRWRIAIFGVCVTVVVNTVIFAYCYGSLSETVQTLENTHIHEAITK